VIPGLCRFALRATGWRIAIDDPGVKKYVLIVAPHTSNWDFLLGIAASRAIGLDARYIGKHTLFRKPFGWIFRRLGGIPVYRDQGRNLTEQLVDHFRENDHLILGLAPEGTRSGLDHWKTGFYHIARAANVPIVMAYLDYGQKEIGMGGTFLPGDSLDECFEKIRAFYAGRQGKNPEKQSLIQPGRRNR
jgi:1-acyl-sn-glycerol-3-phosphate acyltransferase